MTIQKIKSGLFFFGGCCIGQDRIKTNNQERITNNPSKQVQPQIRFLVTQVTFTFIAEGHLNQRLSEGRFQIADKILRRLACEVQRALWFSREFSMMYVQFVITYSLFKTHVTNATAIL